MNWYQRLGVISLCLSAFLAGGTYATQVDHAVNPVPIANLGLTPESVEETQTAVAAMQSLQIVGAESDEDNRSKRVVLTGVLRDVVGEFPWHGPQEIGDCASFGMARPIEIDQAVQIQSGVDIQWRPVDRPWLYVGGRFRDGRIKMRGDGAVPAWIVDHTRERGVLWADEPGLPNYNGQRAKAWGAKPPPSEWADKANPYRVEDAAAVTSAQEVCNAINAGYPVTFGSMQWGTNSIKLVEGRNVARDTTNWPHAQCVVGYDGTTNTYGKRGLFRVDNSWGPEAHNPKSTLPEDAPGGYYITWDDMEKICREGMTFSISGTKGFPKRDLDFSVLGMAMPVPASQEGFTMFEIDQAAGYGLAGVLLAIGVILLAIGRLRGNGHRWAGVMAALLIVGSGVNAAADGLDFTAISRPPALTANEPLDFNVISDPAPVIESVLDECPLNFGAVSEPCDCDETGNCTCGKDCDCTRKKTGGSAKSTREITKPSYPIRGNWWSHSGVQTREQLIQHLQQGQHAGKFKADWLAGLSTAELESLHSDDHERRLKPHVQTAAKPVTPNPAPQAPSSEPQEAIVEIDGRLARYKMTVVSTREQVCVNGVCSFRDVKKVVPVFLGWHK